MRLRSFPLGYVVLPALVMLAVAAGYAGSTASADRVPTDTARVVGDDDGTPVDPRFVEDEKALTPQERLEKAASVEAPKGPRGDAAYEEFLSAMAEHPYVDKVFKARYSARLSSEDRYRLDYGLREFRRHYKAAVSIKVTRDMLPTIGCGLEGDQRHAMELILVDDTDWRKLVDVDVLKAIRSR